MKKIIPSILLVEDERAVRDLFVAFLKSGGYSVITAGNAEEAAYYLFKDRGLDIRLVLVDLVLPNANGLTLIRKLRESKYPQRRNKPVIVLTGRTDTATYKAAARRGIHGYLMKPISCALLLETVAKVLGSGAAALQTQPIVPAPDSLAFFERLPAETD